MENTRRQGNMTPQKVISHMVEGLVDPLSFRNEREIKTFHDKEKLKQYMTTKPAVQKILTGILHAEHEKEHDHKKMGINKSQEKGGQ
jgi:hypothetical protein